MWLIPILVLPIVIIILACLHWRIAVRPYIQGTIRCFVVHDVVRRLSLRSASEISVEQFGFFIDAAMDSGFRFVPPDVFFSHDNELEILLTFDDGLESFYRLVYPILKERRIPALVFTVNSYAGRSPEWDYHTSGRRHLTEDEVDVMKGSGFVTIGCHSATHPDLTRLNRDRLRAELMRTGSDPPKYLSYPFGRFNGEVIRAAEDAGYARGFASLNGRAFLWDRKYAIPRMPLNRFDNRRTIRRKLRGGRLYWCEVLKARFIGLFAPLTYEWRRRP